MTGSSPSTSTLFDLFLSSLLDGDLDGDLDLLFGGEPEIGPPLLFAGVLLEGSGDLDSSLDDLLGGVLLRSDLPLLG